MLILQRKAGESLVIGEDITIRVRGDGGIFRQKGKGIHGHKGQGGGAGALEAQQGTGAALEGEEEGMSAASFATNYSMAVTKKMMDTQELAGPTAGRK